MGTDEVFRALADPTRRRILLLLSTGPRTVGTLAGEFAVTRPAISHHLGVLRRAGLVVERPDGNRRHYSVASDGEGLDHALAFMRTLKAANGD